MDDLKVLLLVGFLALASSSEDESAVKKLVENFAATLKPTVEIGDIVVQFKGFKVSNWSSLRVSGNSSWEKDYGKPDGNLDHVNFTLSLDTLRIDFDQIILGSVQGRFWFDVGANRGEIRTTTAGRSGGGDCDLKVHDAKITELDRVTMHSDLGEFDGIDVSSTFKSIGIPLANRLAKSINMEKFIENKIGKRCSFPTSGA